MPGVVALLVAGAGAVDLLSALFPADQGRLRTVTDVLGLPVASAAAAGSVCVGLLLLLLAHGLRRRKRRAWQLVLVLLLLGAMLHLVKGLDVEEAALSLAVAAALWRYRSWFGAEPDPVSRLAALIVATIGLPLAVGIGLLMLRLNAAAVLGAPSLGAQTRHVLLGLVDISGPVTFRSDRGADLVADVLGALGLFVVIAPVSLALRAPRRAGWLPPESETKVRELLERHGERDSLGYFALRQDKSVLFSASGKSAISYRTVAGVLLASGDPLGDPEAWPGAVTRFLAEANRHAWTPAVLGCSEAAGAVWARHGLSVLEIGDEAVLDVDEFTLDGRAVRGIRQAVARARRAGYHAQARCVRDLTDSELAEVRAAATRWRGAQTERGFSMALGRLGAPGDGDCVVVRCIRRGEDGQELCGLLHFVPWGRSGWSLDVMRRAPQSDNGVTELMIVAAVEAARAAGIKHVSLNFAIFRSALERGERIGAGPALRAWRRVLLAASRFWQIESLYRFNAKFQPRWTPRYLCYPTPADLPRVTVAALEAEAFLTLTPAVTSLLVPQWLRRLPNSLTPRLRGRRVPRQPAQSPIPASTRAAGSASLRPPAGEMPTASDSASRAGAERAGSSVCNSSTG